MAPEDLAAAARRPMIRHLLAAVGLALMAAPATPAAALSFGIGEQAPAAFADGRLRALDLQHARLIVPWDAATTQPASVQTWLDATAAAGLTPHVAFNHRTADRCPWQPCVIPTREQFAQAFARFRASFPAVTTYTVWNEANHNVQPVRHSPETVAGFYDDMRVACPSCTIVAGDVLDSGTSFVRWLQRFEAASTTRPRLWGLHNYGDATEGGTENTDAVLAALPGELWIEETGGILTLRSASGRTTLQTTEHDQARAVTHAFTLARARPRIGRMYLYQWRAEAHHRFDSGLLRPDGTDRPALAAARLQLRPVTPPVPTDAATEEASQEVEATPPDETVTGDLPAQVTWRVRWSGRGRSSKLALTARCAAACAGTVRVTLRTRARSGRAAAHAIRTRTYRVRPARRAQTLRLAVPARALRAARTARSRKLVLTTGDIAAVLPLARPRR